MASRSKASYHHGDLRRALLDAAIAILAAEGSSGLTLRAVSKRTGVSLGAPYHHFPSKAHLLAAVAEEGFTRLYAAQTRAAAAAGADPIARLRAIGVAYVRFAIDHGGHFHAMFREDLTPWDRFPGLRESANLSFYLLQSTIRETGHGEKELLAAWTTVHGVATLWQDGPLRPRAFGGPIAVAEGLLADLGARLATK